MFRVGEVDGTITARVRWVVDVLNSVDTTKATSNLFGERWSKLVANSMVNPLAAITGLRDREMSMNSEVRRLSMLLAIEAVKVGGRRGIRWSRYRNPGRSLGSRGQRAGSR